MDGKNILQDTYNNLLSGKQGVIGSAVSAGLKNINTNLKNDPVLGTISGARGGELYKALEKSAYHTLPEMRTRQGFDLHALMGAPFLYSITDDPPYDTNEYGRSYLKQFLSWGQVVIFSPGMASFLPGIPKFLADKITNSSLNEAPDEGEAIDQVRTEIAEKGGGKLYTFKQANDDYWRYVNTVWRHLVILSGLNTYQSRIAKAYSGKSTLLGIEWDKVTPGNDLSKLLYRSIGNPDVAFHIFEKEFETTFVPFYHDGPITSNDGVDNQAGESNIGQKLNNMAGVGEMAREIAFLSGKSYESVAEEEVIGYKNQKVEGSTILSSKIWGIKTIIPDIWKDASSNSREHQLQFRLACAEGSPESYCFHVLKPLAHLLPLALPIHSKGNFGFTAPFLVRLYTKGITNVDVGLVTSLSIQKDPKSMSAMGLMTDMTVTMTVRDLTPVIALPHDRLGTNAMSAVGYISMLGGLAGVNSVIVDWTKFSGPNALAALKEFISPVRNWHAFQRSMADMYGAAKAYLRG